MCRAVSDGNFLRRIKRERGTHPYDTVKEKWYGGSDANVTGTGTTAAGRKASGRTQKPIYRVAFLMAVAVKSAFALLLTKVTKPSQRNLLSRAVSGTRYGYERNAYIHDERGGF